MELEKNLNEQKEKNKNMLQDFISYQTQIKILSGNLQAKSENIEMLDNEVDVWKLELHKEKIDHYNSLQNLSALEFKLKKIKEKEEGQNKQNQIIIQANNL